MFVVEESDGHSGRLEVQKEAPVKIMKQDCI